MSPLDVRIRFVEQLLFGVAAELRLVPIEETTRRLHLRALELKRVVRSWEIATPPAADVEATVAEIEELARQVRHARTVRTPVGWPRWRAREGCDARCGALLTAS